MNQKAIMSAVVLLLLACSQAGCAAARAGAQDLYITRDGRTEASIVVSPEAGPEEKLAAEDLAKYIEIMSGARPAVADTREAIREALASNAMRTAM